VLAYDYPLLDVFWTITVVSLWIAWIMCVFHVIGDIFRNREMGGGAKALWTTFVLLVPWLGVLVYLAVNGRSMNERDSLRRQVPYDSYSYAQDVASANSGASAEERARLA